VGNSVVRVDDIPVPTTFVDIRTVRATVPAAAVLRALPTVSMRRARSKTTACTADKTVKITVFKVLRGGDCRTGISLRVIAKWMADEKN